jgi:hypothetical protein
MRVILGVGGLALAGAACFAARIFLAPDGPAIGSQVADIAAPTPGVWIFAHRGCRYCEAHLSVLDRTLDLFPDSVRVALARRLTIIGTAPALRAPIPILPDSLRRALGVRRTPETWFVDADRRLRSRWLGARGMQSWRRALRDQGDSP